MVKKNVLNKLSDRELEKYLHPENRFVPEAVQMAYEILKERGRNFSEEEKTDIQNLIIAKQNREIEQIQQENESFEDSLTSDQNAVALYSRELTLVFGFVFGAIPGGILLALNFLKLKKPNSAFAVTAFTIVFSALQHFAVPLFKKATHRNIENFRSSPELLFSAIGATVLYFFWIEIINKTPYRSASLFWPVMIGLISAFISYMNFFGFSLSPFFSSFAR